jgi:hypothetical protein
MSILPQTPKAGRGGCLSGCLRSLFVVFVLGALVVLAVYVIVAPWAFYLGGHFHPLAYWQGWGTMQAPEGDYVVFVRISPPARQGRTAFRLGGPSVGGSGAVCSPHGEMYDSLRLTGGFLRKAIGVNTDGEQVDLGLSQRLNFLGTNSDTRLSLGFRGAWHNPDLVLDDRGSLRRMFNVDGTFYVGDPHKRPQPGKPLPLKLQEGSRAAFEDACAAARRR